jgi:hypothetical protein
MVTAQWFNYPRASLNHSTLIVEQQLVWWLVVVEKRNHIYGLVASFTHLDHVLPSTRAFPVLL